jgi:hypothetical protein
MLVYCHNQVKTNDQPDRIQFAEMLYHSGIRKQYLFHL